MADTAVASGLDGPEGETPYQRQARLRREKRQKRLADEGEDRLAKIKALNGGVAPPDEVLGGPIKAPKIASVDDDPEEVDISQHASFAPTPSQTPNPPNDPLAAAMLQMQQQQGQGGGEDPMLKMMQQMMGSMGGGDPNDPNAQQDLPPMLKAMMNGAGGGQQQEMAPASGSAYVWRIVHAVFAFGLAFYICLTSTFNGTKLARSSDVYTDGAAGYGLGPRLFVIFTSVELVLQSTRYFIERGQLQGGGMFASIVNSGFIPEPYVNYIRVAGRYITIARTIFTDVMVIVFVLGCMAWWKGLAAEA